MHKKSLVILGAGESGIGAALLAKKQGFEVFVSDDGPIRQDFKDELILNKIDFEEGGHTEQKILISDEVVKSPGIPETKEIIKKIRINGINIISEIELAYRFKNESKIIAIELPASIALW